MATKAGVGSSVKRDAYAAGREAASRALEDVGDADLLLLFATARHDQEALLRGVRDGAPGAAISGCSGEGIILPGTSLEQDYAVGALAVRSSSFRFEPFLIEGYVDAPEACGRALAERVRAGAEPVVGVLVFPDGLGGDCTALLEAASHALAAPVMVAGGAASEGMGLGRTFQYGDGRAAHGALAGVVVRGAGRMAVAVSHGCTPIGRVRTITRAEGPWVHEIDGHSAWSVFREYLDGAPEDLRAEGVTHICIGRTVQAETPGDEERFVIHAPLALDKTTGALAFPGGGLRTGQSVRLTRRDADRIRDTAARSAEEIRDHAGGLAPALVLQFDCVGRGRALFGDATAANIVTPLQRRLGDAVPWLGFHCYGEIATVGSFAKHHNYTVVLCALFEDGGA
jgi:hypothetical protein